MANMFDHIKPGESPRIGQKRDDVSREAFRPEMIIPPLPTKQELSLLTKTSHTPFIPQPKSDLGASWHSGVTNSAIGKLALTPATKLLGPQAENKLREMQSFQPQTLGEKATSFLTTNLTDAPLWMAGEAAAGKLLSPLSKTKPIANIASKLPKPLSPIIGGGIRDAAAYGSVVAPAETIANGDGLQGLLEREKQLPAMALGGATLRGVGIGLGKGFDAVRPIKLPELKSNPLEDVQNAYRKQPLQALEPPSLKPGQFTNADQIKTRANQFSPLNMSKAEKISSVPSVTPKLEQKIALPQNNLGSADTFREKIDRTPAKRKKITDVIKGLRTQFVDDLAPLEELEKKVTGKVADASESIYKQGRLFRGSPEKAHEFIQSKLAPVIKEVEAGGKSYQDLGDYALAVHAKDVNAKGIQSGFTDAEIADTIRKFGTPEMEAARQKLMSVNDELMNSLVQSGVIEQSLVNVLKEKHPNYMPLFRSFDDDKVEFGAGLSKALANVSSPIQKLKGSERDVIDPIESMIKNVFKSISASDRNNVASKLGRLADLDDGTIIRRISDAENTSRLNTVYAMENGKKVHYEVQPDVYRALMNLDKESSNLLIKVLQKPAGMLRAGATLTPEFSLRNPMRDVVQAYVTSKSGLNPIVDVPRALFEVIKSKRGAETSFNDFLRQNGGFGNIVSMDRKVHQNVIKDIITESPGRKFINIINTKSLMDVLRTITDVTESATKLAEYNAAIRSGATKSEAAYRARDLMDFGRSGASIREANKVIAFLNANIQGKSKLIRSIKENPVQFTTRSITAITLPTVGVYLSQKYLANDYQKKTIEDAPDWLRENFWLMPVPGTNQVARIPKPFDLGPIFANLPERTLRFIADNDPEAFDGFAKQTLASYSIPTMITGLLPFVEGMSNYSFFRQGPIIPQREDDLNFPDQYDINTSEVAKVIGKGVNKLTGGEGMFKNFGSPRIVDNTIRGVTGGLGTYATNAIDLGAELTGLVDSKNKPSRNISELPVLKAFLAPERVSSQSMSNLYDEKDKLTREKGSAKANKQEFVNLYRLKQLEQASGKISDITKEMRQIENDRLMSPNEKRDKLNELNRIRNELAMKTRK